MEGMNDLSPIMMNATDEDNYDTTLNMRASDDGMSSIGDDDEDDDLDDEEDDE